MAKNNPLFIPVAGGESWWLHVNIVHSKVALFENIGKEYILCINQPTQNLWSSRNTRNLDLAFALKQVRSEKEPEEKLPKDVGIGVRGWVLNILVSFCFMAVLQGVGDLSCPTGMDPTPLHWKHGVLITRLAGMSPDELFEISKPKSMF